MSLPKENAFIAYIGVPLFFTAFSWFVCESLSQADSEVFQRLCLAAHITVTQGTQSLLAQVLHLVVLTAAVVSGFVSGVKLMQTARIIVWTQLFIGFIVLQCLLSMAFAVSGHPLGYMVAITLGMCGGWAVRLLLDREEAYESQYYDLATRNAELQSTRIQLVKQDEQERRILAADLHDQVLNDLKSAKQKVSDLSANPTPEAISTLYAVLSQAIEQVREVMDSLCPSVLENIGLVAAIEDCLRRGSQRAGYKLHMKSIAEPQVLATVSIVEQTLLYRIVQEAVNNICKHAQAENVSASIRVEPGFLRIEISDDGKGFDFGVIHTQARGLRFMRQRADLIGATVRWMRNDLDKDTGTICQIDHRWVEERVAHPDN